MTLAQDFIKEFHSRTVSCGRLAGIFKGEGRLRAIEIMDEKLTLYHFVDGTKVGTRGRGTNFQMWTGEER